MSSNELAIVLTPIRTGSTSFALALRKCGVDSIHVTQQSIPFRFWSKCASFENKDFFTSLEMYNGLYKPNTTDIILSQFIQHAKKFYNRVRIFTIYREPIERALSTFVYLFANHQKIIQLKTSIDWAQNVINNGFIYGKFAGIFLRGGQAMPLFGTSNSDYIIEELMVERGAQRFSFFDYKSNYISVEKDETEQYIGVRLRDNNKWSKILADLYGKQVMVKKINPTSNKYNFYTNLINAYSVPQSYINDILMYDTMLYKFLTLEERQNYIDTWRNRSC